MAQRHAGAGAGRRPRRPRRGQPHAGPHAARALPAAPSPPTLDLAAPRAVGVRRPRQVRVHGQREPGRRPQGHARPEPGAPDPASHRRASQTPARGGCGPPAPPGAAPRRPARPRRRRTWRWRGPGAPTPTSSRSPTVPPATLWRGRGDPALPLERRPHDQRVAERLEHAHAERCGRSARRGPRRPFGCRFGSSRPPVQPGRARGGCGSRPGPARARSTATSTAERRAAAGPAGRRDGSSRRSRPSTTALKMAPFARAAGFQYDGGRIVGDGDEGAGHALGAHADHVGGLGPRRAGDGQGEAGGRAPGRAAPCRMTRRSGRESMIGQLSVRDRRRPALAAGRPPPHAERAKPRRARATYWVQLGESGLRLTRAAWPFPLEVDT